MTVRELMVRGALHVLNSAAYYILLKDPEATLLIFECMDKLDREIEHEGTDN
jgi:hypothetical protein